MKLGPDKKPKAIDRTKLADALRGREADHRPISFNPKSDIPADVWAHALKRAEQEDWWEDMRDYTQIRLHTLAAIIAPERTRGISANEETVKDMQQNIDVCRNQLLEIVTNSRSFARNAITLATILHDRREDFNLDDKLLGSINDSIEQYAEIEGYGNETLFRILASRLLFPPQTDEQWKEYDQYWDDILKLIKSYKREEKWGQFRVYATFTTLAFPHKKDQLPLDADAWDGLIGDYDKLKKRGANRTAWIMYAARDLTILTAEEAEITPDGRIRITPKQPSMEDKPELPVRKTI